MSSNGENPAPPTHKALALRFKRDGSFDKQRKILLENFKGSQTHKNLLLKLKLMVENKVRRDPSLLLANKGKVAALIQGELFSEQGGSSVLGIVDKDIQEKILDSPEFFEKVKVQIKDINRVILGVSDEDYAKICEEENKAKRAEEKKLEKEREEREFAYKNNFKVKQLVAPLRVAKPPRFNLQLDRGRDPYGRGGYNSPRGGPGGLLY